MKEGMARAHLTAMNKILAALSLAVSMAGKRVGAEA